MLKAIIISVLFIIEAFAILVSIFIKNFAITSLEREITLLNETPLIFYRERLILGLVVATILTVLLMGIYLVFKSLKKDMFPYKTWKIFLLQWIILFTGTMIGLIVDFYYLKDAVNT